MKKYFSILLAGAALAFTACESNDTEGLTSIEYYPTFTLEGGNVVYLSLGESYTDNFTCTYMGEDYSSNARVIITDMVGDRVKAVSTDSPNIYTIYYSAVNPNGYAWSESRTVFVFDPNNTVDISGVYDCDYDKSVYMTGLTFNEMTADRGYPSVPSVCKVSLVVPGIYEVSDLFGGWYAGIRGYGERYEMKSTILLNEDNTFSLISSHVSSWGDSLDGIEDAVYDPETKSLSWTFVYASQISASCYVAMPAEEEEEEEPKCPNCGGTGCQGDCNM